MDSTPEIHFPDFCPECPERKDLTINANIKYCGLHNPSMSGDKDRTANPLMEPYYPTTNAEEGDPAICDFIHRRIIR